MWCVVTEVYRSVGQSLEDLGLFVVFLINNLLDLLWFHSAQILGLTSLLSKSRIFRSVSVPVSKMLPNPLKNPGQLLSSLKTLLFQLTNIFLYKVECFLDSKISHSLFQNFLFFLPFVLFVIIINRYFDHSM